MRVSSESTLHILQQLLAVKNKLVNENEQNLNFQTTRIVISTSFCQNRFLQPQIRYLNIQRVHSPIATKNMLEIEFVWCIISLDIRSFWNMYKSLKSVHTTLFLMKINECFIILVTIHIFKIQWRFMHAHKSTVLTYELTKWKIYVINYSNTESESGTALEWDQWVLRYP